MIYDTPEEIQRFRLLSMKGRLKLEIAGLKFKGPSVYKQLKKEFGFTGNKKKVLEQLTKYIEDNNMV